MDKNLSVIKTNAEYAKKCRSFSECVISSQIEELLLLYENNSFSEADEVADVFKNVFELPLLSSDFLQFCMYVCKAKLFSFRDDNPPLYNNKIACLHNEYCEDALESLKRYMELEAEFENDFTSVCEAVYSKRCNYALLPLYNTHDGLIVSMYKLMQKYDLHISSSTRVLMSDGSTETDFFLISNGICNISEMPSRLFLSVVSSSDDTVAQLLHSFCKCDISVMYINTLPVYYADDRMETVMIVDISNVNADAVKLFLKASLAYSTVVGVYPIVK